MSYQRMQDSQKGTPTIDEHHVLVPLDVALLFSIALLRHSLVGVAEGI
jgi:hypothetical protein